MPARALKASLRVRVAVAVFCALSVAGLWVVTLDRLEGDRAVAIASATADNDAIAVAIEGQVARTLAGVRNVAQVVRYDWARGGGIPDVVDIASRFADPGEEPHAVAIIDATGRMLASSRPSAGGSFAQRDFFLAQRDAPGDALCIGRPVLGRTSGLWQVPMTLPLRDAEGRFQGVVLVSVRTERIVAAARLAEVGREGIVSVVGRDGIVRARWSGTVVSQGQDVSGSAPFRALAQSPNGHSSGQGAIDGRVRLFSHRSLRDHPLVVVVGTELDTALRDVQQRRSDYLLLASLASAGMFAFATLVWVAMLGLAATTRRLHARETLYHATFENAAMGIAQLSRDGRLRGVNQRLCDMLGLNRETLPGLRLADLASMGDGAPPDAGFDALLAAAEAGHLPEAERRYRASDGAERWLHEAYGVVRDTQGQLQYFVVTLQDVTARRHLEHRLAHAAQHDTLTGLPNRALLRDRLLQGLARAVRRGTQVGVLYIDLDGFKAVNDTLGHAAGDVLLCEVAQRLRGCIRAEDTVGRLGGDEFALVLLEVPDARVCVEVARKLIARIGEPMRVDGRAARVGASVGIALSGHGTGDADELLRRADEAMFTAKRAGRGRFAVAAGDGDGGHSDGWLFASSPTPLA